MVNPIQTKIVIIISVLACSAGGFSQTSFIAQKYHQVSEQVTAIKSYSYAIHALKRDTLPNKIETVTLKNGVATSISEEYLKHKIKHVYNYKHSRSKRNFIMHYKRFKDDQMTIDSSLTFKKIDYEGLHFFYPKKAFKTEGRLSTFNRVEFSFELNGKREIRWLEKHTDTTITEVIYKKYDTNHEKTYHSNGHLIEKRISGFKIEKYSYNDAGLLISKTSNDKLMYRSYQPSTITQYHYTYDPYGNWVQCVQVTFNEIDRENTLSTTIYTGRELTYKDGESTGNTAYDPVFVNTVIEQQN